ncbi:GNAT family N-acetyltransferase [Clostridium ihumii]|uniref:GNAT family N-acetyltransferase n=1 Tax=Clostridium ihumii TaxID=1470356 RepID=UPI003D329C86
MCYGIYLGNELVGQYSILNIKKDIMEIMNISVNEKYQGRGLGKQLIFHAINFAKEENAKLLEIGTGNSSINQLKLYQKCGFRINGIYKDYFKLNYDEEIFENDIRCIDMIRLSINL